MEPKEGMRVATGTISGDMTRHLKEFISFALEGEPKNSGVYYFAITASACYFESVLEEFTIIWCKSKANANDGYISRLMSAVEKDVTRATGLDAWKKWMEVFYNIDCPKILSEDWKRLTLLFKLRNQLAHGRTTKFTHFWNAQDGKHLGMTIQGSAYEEPFEYLIEKNIIKIEDGHYPNSESLLTHSVASFFWDVVDRSIISIEEILAKEVPDFPRLSHISRKTNLPKID